MTTIARELPSIKSLDTLLYFSKSVLLLLMDDEEEIRARNSEVVMQLVGKTNQKVVPIFAQELFIDFLTIKLDNFDKYEAIALVLLIVIDGAERDNSLDDHIVEYRVFDKNEVNIFGENFIVKKMCLSALKQQLGTKAEVAKIIEACKKFSDCGDLAAIENFLLNLI